MEQYSLEMCALVWFAILAYAAAPPMPLFSSSSQAPTSQRAAGATGGLLSGFGSNHAGHGDKRTPLDRAWRRVKHFQANTTGRDFVVGDLHGCLEALGRLMEAVRFNPARDRLFSVGDLVDRGPFSMACLKLLHMPWFHAVRGNHELQLIRHLEDPHHEKAFDEAWLRQQSGTFGERKRFAGDWLPFLRALPLVIVVGSGENRFQLVHGELLEEGRSVDDAMIDAWSFSDPRKAERRATEGRILLRTHKNGGRVKRAHDPVAMSPTYCGHTIVEAPFRLAGQIFLDRGAFLGQHLRDRKLAPKEDEAPEKNIRAGLVMVEPATGQAWLAPTDPPTRAHPVNIVELQAR